jgi:hypothetical protein
MYVAVLFTLFMRLRELRASILFCNGRAIFLYTIFRLGENTVMHINAI